MDTPWRNYTSEISRGIRFGIVGLVAAGIYWALATCLIDIADVEPLLASVCAHIITGIASYVGHLFFSFRVAADHATFGPRFLLVAVFALAINVGVFRGMTALGFRPSLAILVLSIVIPAANYAANRFWVFASGLNDMSGPAEKVN